MSTAQFGAIANAKKGEDWAFVDSSGAYSNFSVLKIPDGGYYLYDDALYLLTKLQDNGLVVWQKTLSVSARLVMADIMSDGTILFDGTRDELNDKGAIGRFNPDTGNFVWYKYFLMGSQVQLFTVKMSKDPTNTYAYVSFTRNTTADPNLAYATISQINLSNGSVNWTREVLAPTGLNSYVLKSKVDASGNVYLAGFYQQDSQSKWRGYLVKFNSSGTVQWQRVFTRTEAGDFTDRFFTEDVAVDSDGNIHVPGTYRYAGDPTYGDALYYSKINSSGALINHYSIIPDPVPTIDIPTFLESVRGSFLDSSNNYYMYVYGRFNRQISTQYTGTLVKISGGNTLSYLTTVYMGDSVTQRFSGPGGFAFDSSTGSLVFSIYTFVDGPETIYIKMPADGSSVGFTVAPKSLKASVKNIMPAVLSTPPVTFEASSMTIRNGTESYTFEDVSASTAATATYERYIQRF